MFQNFERLQVDVGDGITINAVRGGNGPPLLLLHGYPQTHSIWHKVAPTLAEHFTVVASDLRGYGDSSKPTGKLELYSKRAMALDQVRLMQSLGFERFFLAGHDRGARVSHRLAVDHPERVARLAVLDISPTLKMYEGTSQAFARAYWHWFFLIQPAPLPETLIGANPQEYLRARMARGDVGLTPFMPEAWSEYLRCFDAATIHASCQDYRAAASLDLELDRADRTAHRTLEMPVLTLWGKHGTVEQCFSPVNDWHEVARDVRGEALPCGHYLPEEAPDAVTKHFLEFFGDEF
jgi:haloacetate dehalogenase